MVAEKWKRGGMRYSTGSRRGEDGILSKIFKRKWEQLVLPRPGFGTGMGNFSTFWDGTGIGVPRPKPTPLPSLVLLEVLGIPLEAKLYGKSYASLWYDLFGNRRMQEFFSIKRDLKGRCGFNFTFIHLCGLLVQMPLEGFLFQVHILIG